MVMVSLHRAHLVFPNRIGEAIYLQDESESDLAPAQHRDHSSTQSSLAFLPARACGLILWSELDGLTFTGTSCACSKVAFLFVP